LAAEVETEAARLLVFKEEELLFASKFVEKANLCVGATEEEALIIIIIVVVVVVLYSK
jgi:hypothetical protein